TQRSTWPHESGHGGRPMNENDVQDREVREYVRNRMAAEMSPEFTRDVMNDVQRTPQRRRGFALPIVTGLATVAVAAAVVIIGLGLLNDNGGVGSDPTPTPSPTAAPASSVTPEASASAESTTSPTPAATTGIGEFGPIHSMAPEDAFANAQTCENPDAITTVGEPSGLSYTVSFPGDWYSNEGSESRSACTLFAPDPFDAPDDQSVPAEVTIAANLPPGGDFDAGPGATSEDFTVDGVAATRYDIPAGGFTTERTIVWIIAIAGNLPAEGNDQPYLAVSTSSSDSEELAVRADMLDRMVATLNIGE
ncbi:MAG: hypothetical protein ACXWYG_11845, partial [Aeromicrobium sp.]